jgi:hypothetical protein
MISEDRKTIAIEAKALMTHSGFTQEQVGQKLGISSSAVAGCLRDYKKHLLEHKIIRFQERGTGKKKKPAVYKELPIYGIAPNITEDWIIDIGDTHYPETNYLFMDAMLGVAMRVKRKFGRVALNICGDIASQNAVSPHPQTDIPMSLDEEFGITGANIDKLAEVFDAIYIELGNHCFWLDKFVKGQLGDNSFVNYLMSHVLSDRVKIYKSTYATIDSGNRRWLTTHTVQYQQTGKVASVLNVKHSIDTLTHHEHQIGRGRDPYGRQNWINVGGGFDYNLQKYPHIFTTTRRVMQNSFVLLREGRPYEFAPYEAYGEKWEDWGVDPTAMYAYEQQKRMINEFKLTEKEFAAMAESEAA